jgi:hypothetical protein
MKDAAEVGHSRPDWREADASVGGLIKSRNSSDALRL